MANISNFKRQHEEVSKIITYLKKETNNTSEENAFDIAKNISILAGKLKIHLREEDNSIYPMLLDSENKELREFGKEYNDEMKDIFEKFINFKNKYNTKSKLMNNIEGFKLETNKMINKLETRINKEDNHLYPILEKI